MRLGTDVTAQVSAMKLPVAIIGLGRVASRFDEEPGRTVVWTHAGAYLARADRFRIAGACEPMAENVAQFQKRCPDVPVVNSIDALFDACQPVVVSICTPTAAHMPALRRALAAPSVRLIWCEKPLAGNLADAEAVLAQARDRDIRIVVSHVRRWTPLWRAAHNHVRSGALGKIACVRIAMPNRLLSIGSHAVDLALMLGGDVTDVRPLPVPALDEGGEPAVAALLTYESGAYGIVQVTGLRDALIVEAEVIGSDGRMTVREDSGEIRIERFVADDRYAGYRRLGAADVETHATLGSMSPFVEIANELDRLALDGDARPTCDGQAALAVEKVLQQCMPRKDPA